MIVLGNQENINSNITLNSSIMAENDINIKGQVQKKSLKIVLSTLLMEISLLKQVLYLIQV